MILTSVFMIQITLCWNLLQDKILWKNIKSFSFVYGICAVGAQDCWSGTQTELFFLAERW